MQINDKYSLNFFAVFYAKTVGYILLMLPMAFIFITNSIQKADVYFFSTNAFIEAWNNFQIIGNKCEIYMNKSQDFHFV